MNWSELKPTSDTVLRIAVIGKDLSDSLLPHIMTAGCASLGKPYEVVTLNILHEEFEPCVNQLVQCGFRGAAIAPPHKAIAAKMALRFFTVKHSMGVANTLGFESEGIFAQNTEVLAIQELTSQIPTGTALLLGGGSGARSVAVALLESGWRLKVWNRNGMRARLMQSTLARYGKIEILANAEPIGCSLVVNATALGSRAGEKPPVNWHVAKPRTTVFDLVYRRVPTDLLREATMRGFSTIDGRQLVVEKTAQSLEWWTGEQVNRTMMYQAAGLR